jgi:hypothetical protein
MPNYAIRFAANKVVRRLTTIDPPPLAPDEDAIVVDPRFDLAESGGTRWWKALDNGSKSPASAQEADDAGLNQDAVKTRLLAARTSEATQLNIMADVNSSDAQVIAASREWARQQKILRSPLGR